MPPRKPIELHASMPVFLLLMIPTLGYAFYYSTEKPKMTEDTESSIRERYPHIVRHYQAQSSGMVKVIQDVVHGNVDPEQQKKMDQLVQGGKGSAGIHRETSVDPALYGTAEGVKAKLQYEQQRAQKLEEKKQRKAMEKQLKKEKREKKKKAAAAAEAEPLAKETTTASGQMNTVTKSIGVVAVVGVVAAVAVTLMGGRSRS